MHQLERHNVVNQRLAERVLTNRGHHVAIASNGLEALDALERRAFDVVLLDMQMPELDGWETVRALRARETDRRARRTPVIAVTAHALREDRARCLAAGMDGYVSKPLDAKQLFAAIERFAPETGADIATSARLRCAGWEVTPSSSSSSRTCSCFSATRRSASWGGDWKLRHGPASPRRA